MKKGGADAEAFGRSQGGFSTKVPSRATGGGKLMTLMVTPGQRHEAVAFEALRESGAVKYPEHTPTWSSGRI